MTAQYSIGIDLGTTNSVLAYLPLETDRTQSADVRVLEVPQLVAAGTIEAKSSLPSFLYLATDEEASGPALGVPWSEQNPLAVGEYARRQAAEVPDRTVAAAKSWLAHSKVDRHRPILPWMAPDEVPKVSPVEASRHYLAHLAAAWNQAHPEAPLADQQVVLTVPASFDAAARELTRDAALAAGLPEEFVLLEEPQAAVYCWLSATGDHWRRMLGVGDTLLVCDVGGGTSDFTLVGVSEEEGELALRRVAVGNHLLVGGDNMDLALAHHVAEHFAQQGTQLDPWQSVGLWHSCRAAKEALLRPGGAERQAISVLGRGSRLIGGTVSVEVQRAAVAELLVDGFFPPCSLDDRPERQRLSGFQEIGLPFESDTAVTRHLAAFLGAQRGNQGATAETPAGDDAAQGSGPVSPTHVLFNGGVFKADALRGRLLDVLGQWYPGDASPQPLPGEHELDHAAAKGAAYYGWTKQAGGVRIRGGTARSYYVGIETAGLAVPGAPRPLRALCVVPFGMEEGTSADVPGGEIGLVVGEPAQFRFFSSPTRQQDKPGDLLPRVTGELEETDPLEAELPVEEGVEEPYVPVQFQSRITELGMFELWCKSTQSDRRWKLEFNVREE